jgi:hypothetical protein
VCTTISEQATITGSGKNGPGWFRIDHACLGYDHPSHAPLEHAILLDLTGGPIGSPTRLAVELSLDSARRLANLLAETIRQAETYEQSLVREGPDRIGVEAASLDPPAGVVVGTLPTGTPRQ